MWSRVGGVADTYHHGDLRAQVLASAVELIASEGPDALSLRELARRAGVSHAAPAHHFGDRRGLFTAVAVEGFELLAAALSDSASAGRFDETAVAYVSFALAHPGHFAVMFRGDLVTASDAGLRRARARAGAQLGSGLDAIPDERLVVDRDDARRSAWAIVHGISTLALSGALEGSAEEASALARQSAQQLFGERRC